MTQRAEFLSADAAPAVLYAKRGIDDPEAYPILASEFGGILVNHGMIVPIHDEQVIDESAAPDVTITYKLGGVTVGTKTITVSGTTTTIVMS